MLNVILLRSKELNIVYKTLIYLIPLSIPTQSLFNSALGFCVSLFSLKNKKTKKTKQKNKNKNKTKQNVEAFQALRFFFFFNIYFFNIYTSPTFLSPLSFHLPITSIFLPPLAFHLPTTLYINIILLLSLISLYFCLFLFTPFYYKFVTISSILCIVFPLKKKVSSLSLSKFFGGFFYFSCISTLGW